MPADFSTDALVIRTVPSGENDRLLTLLSAKQGSISVLAKGARSLKSRYMAACMPFVYGNFELHPGKGGDLFFLREGFPTETFREIGGDIVKTYLAQYICDVCCELSGPGAGAEELRKLVVLRLCDLQEGDVVEQKALKVVGGEVQKLLAGTMKADLLQGANFAVDVEPVSHGSSHSFRARRLLPTHESNTLQPDLRAPEALWLRCSTNNNAKSEYIQYQFEIFFTAPLGRGNGSIWPTDGRKI